MVMRLIVHGIQLQAEIGARAHEQGRRQVLLVDVDLEIEPPANDDLASAVDYHAIVERAQAIAEGGHIVLIETFAERMASACAQLDRVIQVDVVVRKPSALAPAMAGACASRTVRR